MPKKGDFQWSLEDIRSGVYSFQQEFGRFPTARDFDAYSKLPSARQIQFRFGGLPKIREDLGLDGPLNFTSGSTRSETATRLFSASRAHEEEFYSFLTQFIPEVQVHEQKRLRPGDVASDFFIYTDPTEISTGFAIDIFYAASSFNLTNIINIKLKRYRDLPFTTYLVAKIDQYTQEEVEVLMASKKNKLPQHIHVYVEEEFKRGLARIYTAHGGVNLMKT